MTEVVASVARVTGLMAGMSAASREQSIGIDQINEAIAQMDQVTQQNAALVEEAAAAAASMQDQADSLAQVAAGFRLATTQDTAGSAKSAAPASSAAPAPASAAQRRPTAKPATKRMALR